MRVYCMHMEQAVLQAALCRQNKARVHNCIPIDYPSASRQSIKQAKNKPRRTAKWCYRLMLGSWSSMINVAPREMNQAQQEKEAGSAEAVRRCSNPPPLSLCQPNNTQDAAERILTFEMQPDAPAVLFLLGNGVSLAKRKSNGVWECE